VTRSIKQAARLLTARRALLAFVVGSGGAAGLSGFTDFLGSDHQLGYPGLIAFVVLTGALAAATAVELAGANPAHSARKDRREAEQNLATMLRQAAPALTRFAGRRETLEHWEGDYADLVELRRKREKEQGPVGPMVLAIHGPAGVGKSTLAWELARRLLEHGGFDGLLVATFGSATTSRGPADISRDMLRQLDWPDEEMPANVADRVALLRSITSRRALLFVFDAVRDYDQVRHVMPAGSGCVVILASRREIASLHGIPPRPPLKRPSTESGVEILSALSGVPWTFDPEIAVEVVELCGGSPLAIRAAADLARATGDLHHIAGLLRPHKDRLRVLDHRGRMVSNRLESEFNRLPPDQRAAITHLAHLDSDSFVPWVLRPLLGLDQHESARLASELEKPQLIERIDDDPTGQPRYRVDPLARLYAIANPLPADLREARENLDEAYLDLIDDVLAQRPDGYTLIRTGSRRGRTAESNIAEKIAPALDEIVRREYLNLIRVIETADMKRYARLIWRVAAMLDGRVPPLPPKGWDRVCTAFERALEAADDAANQFKDTDRHARAEVEFGLAQFLIATEHYEAGFTALDRAEGHITATERDPQKIVLRRLRIARIRAWAYVQADNFNQARKSIWAAQSLVQSVSDDVRRDDPHFLYDYDLIQAFGREARVDVDTARPADTHTTDIASLRATVERAGHQRRSRQWLAARRTLRPLLDRDGDARGRATVLYEMSRLNLEEAHALIGADKRDQAIQRALEAARLAAECAYMFLTINNTAGRIRARCLITRALVIAGHDAVARIRIQLTESELAHYTASMAEAEEHAVYEPLKARLERAYGEVEYLLGGEHRKDGWAHLATAAQLFYSLDDTSNYNEVMTTLSRIKDY
jgi:hypothetical protein